jgi:hypothetical protein
MLSIVKGIHGLAIAGDTIIENLTGIWIKKIAGCLGISRWQFQRTCQQLPVKPYGLLSDQVGREFLDCELARGPSV